MLITPFHPFPVLETERLLLIKMNESHLQRLHEMRTNDAVMHYLQKPKPKTLEETMDNIKSNIDLIEKQEGISWVVTVKDENLMAGVIGFWRMKKEHSRPEIGYLMLPQYWHKGIMSEALCAVIRYAFETMQANSIEADINPQNEASANILKRNGFLQEAYFRQNLFFEEKFYDSAVYSLLKSEWKS